MFYIHQEAEDGLDESISWLLGGLCSDTWRPRGPVNSISAFIIQELLTHSNHMGLVVMVAVDTVQTTYGMCGCSPTWAASISYRSGGSGLWPPKTFGVRLATCYLSHLYSSRWNWWSLLLPEWRGWNPRSVIDAESMQHGRNIISDWHLNGW